MQRAVVEARAIAIAGAPIPRAIKGTRRSAVRKRESASYRPRLNPASLPRNRTSDAERRRASANALLSTIPRYPLLRRYPSPSRALRDPPRERARSPFSAYIPVLRAGIARVTRFPRALSRSIPGIHSSRRGDYSLRRATVNPLRELPLIDVDIDRQHRYLILLSIVVTDRREDQRDAEKRQYAIFRTFRTPVQMPIYIPLS